jgi:hypothetical protein
MKHLSKADLARKHKLLEQNLIYSGIQEMPDHFGYNLVLYNVHAPGHPKDKSTIARKVERMMIGEKK